MEFKPLPYIIKRSRINDNSITTSQLPSTSVSTSNININDTGPPEIPKEEIEFS